MFVTVSLSTLAEQMAACLPVIYVLGREGGAGWITAVVLARLAVATVCAPVAGVVAGRWSRQRLMMFADGGRAGVLACGAGLMVAQAPLWSVLVWSMCATVLAAPYRPSAVVLLHLRSSEDDHPTVNAFVGMLTSTALFAGPAFAAAATAVWSVEVATSCTAAMFLLAAVVLAARVPVDVPARIVGRRTVVRMVRHDLVAGAGLIRHHRVLAALAVLVAAQTFQLGGELVLHPLMVTDRLGMSEAGLGVIGAAQGIGGLLVLPFMVRLGHGRRTAQQFLASIIVMAITMFALGFVHSVGIAVALLVVAGLGSIVYEVLILTLLRRAVPIDQMAPVLGFFDAVAAAASIAGVVGGFVLSSLGVGLALAWFGAAVVGVSVVATAPLLRGNRALETERRRLAPVVARLRSIGLFGNASQSALECVAAGAIVRSVQADTLVLVEGDRPDHFYVVLDGELEVSLMVGGAAGLFGPNDWFGEIGLLKNSPRTASVRTVTNCDLLEITGDAFLSAFGAPDMVPDSIRQVMSLRLEHSAPWLLAVDGPTA
jgi:MFS family permease